MQIEFKKEQITKKQNSITIDYGEYKLSLPNWMIKNNSFTVDDNYTYWVFNLENVKKEMNGQELLKLLKPYISEQKITVNKQEAPKEYYLNDIKLEPLTFYEGHNSWFIGEITDYKTKITNPCFKYNITWEQDNKSFKINHPYNHSDLSINYIITSYKHISTHNEKVFLI
ncbi:MAG: hypothetical protein PPFGHCPK_01322 [Spiroplasma endosymbiont of Drosophila atripex]|nr:MAG: hypothetical protein PPFGHCPK_00034 [Spiroplasma endosymbiont of Drosophila atripex]WDA53867.1 MAG: hypothetical protein PPFGHCPK_00281 [Spiroplasma endosymbiont of Drosophila atripex]WDA54623.1 MAG: hypothetical protein PPFGHCPK_01079 [Spiroplasma endosymbiont of Drosophila atripex]WDA54841.1 MAG: hypothetical protein PPFGHCPK_01322 [Spiroplasma endosymbiont of Drosophila atripex]